MNMYKQLTVYHALSLPSTQPFCFIQLNWFRWLVGPQMVQLKCSFAFVFLRIIRQSPLSEADAQTVDRISKTLELTMSTLSQMVAGFLHCYEAEMKSWCKRPKPVLSGRDSFELQYYCGVVWCGVVVVVVVGNYT